MQLLHACGEIIAQRYRILNILGQGGVGTTYEALDLQTRQRVALKALSLRRMTDWKKMELFKREARILSQLNHPAIPCYLDYFEVDTPQDRCFYIAQHLAMGKSLAVLVESGWHPDEAEVRRLASQILEILVYLHSLTPPVIHRDIKPQNIIRQDDGQVFLVDFGAVQDTYHHAIAGGSTIVGTYGYMAPEQFRGQAVLSTDLYGLGTTLLFLLTRKSPADLPQRQLKINFRSHVCLSKDFADWLERMVEPAIEDRFHSAQETLAVLRGKQVLTSNLAQTFRQLKHSRIALINTRRRLIVEIPPIWLASNERSFFRFLTRICKIFLPLFLITPLWAALPIVFVVTTKIADSLGYMPADWLLSFLSNFVKFLMGFGIVFLSFYFLIGLWKMGEFLLGAASRTCVEIDPEHFQLQQWFLGLCYKKVQGLTKDINQVKLSSIGLPLNKKPFTVCLLRSKLSKHHFGLFLRQQEKEWLVEEIGAFLGK